MKHLKKYLTNVILICSIGVTAAYSVSVMAQNIGEHVRYCRTAKTILKKESLSYQKFTQRLLSSKSDKKIIYIPVGDMAIPIMPRRMFVRVGYIGTPDNDKNESQIVMGFYLKRHQQASIIVIPSRLSPGLMRKSVNSYAIGALQDPKNEAGLVAEAVKHGSLIGGDLMEAMATATVGNVNCKRASKSIKPLQQLYALFARSAFFPSLVRGFVSKNSYFIRSKKSYVFENRWYKRKKHIKTYVITDGINYIDKVLIPLINGDNSNLLPVKRSSVQWSLQPKWVTPLGEWLQSNSFSNWNKLIVALKSSGISVIKN